MAVTAHPGTLTAIQTEPTWVQPPQGALLAVGWLPHPKGKISPRIDSKLREDDLRVALPIEIGSDDSGKLFSPNALGSVGRHKCYAIYPLAGRGLAEFFIHA